MLAVGNKSSDGKIIIAVAVVVPKCKQSQSVIAIIIVIISVIIVATLLLHAGSSVGTGRRNAVCDTGRFAVVRPERPNQTQHFGRRSGKHRLSSSSSCVRLCRIWVGRRQPLLLLLLLLLLLVLGAAALRLLLLRVSDSIALASV